LYCGNGRKQIRLRGEGNKSDTGIGGGAARVGAPGQPARHLENLDNGKWGFVRRHRITAFLSAANIHVLKVYAKA
jgi:hypothetical protein